MKKYAGKRIYEGISIGKIIRYESNVIIDNNKSLGYDKEKSIFINAKEILIKTYNDLYKKSVVENNSQAEIFLTFINILEDYDFLDNIEENLKKGFSATNSIVNSSNSLQKMLINIDNDYLKERAKDIEEISIKLIKIIQGDNNYINFNEKFILVTSNLSVVDFMTIPREKILGIVLEDISPNSHVAILIRSFGIPSISLINQKVNFIKNELCVLDSTNSVLLTSVNNENISKYQSILKDRQLKLEKLISYKDKDVQTIDNKKIKVYANISSSYEIDSVLDCNPDGIGLFRSEFIYLNANTFPSEEEQFEIYKLCVSKMNNKPTIIRTFDIGADKKINYFNIPEEANPFLGYRGVRLYYEFKDVFITQLMALYRASIYGNLKVMIPMVSNMNEIKYVYKCIQEAKNNLINRNINFNEKMAIGVMIETVSAALICDELCEYVDFFSIGTNDLTQYVLAIDRENSKVLNSYDHKSKAILRLIYYISSIVKSKGKEIGICGELAREKELLPFFINCGIDELSVSLSYVLECKKNITEIDTRYFEIKKYL